MAAWMCHLREPKEFVMGNLFTWKLRGDGKTLAPGEVVEPDERLTWTRTIGIGAQHVIAISVRL